MSIWNELGIEPTTDSRAIKRAYAARLKQVHPEDDPEGFQRLRKAYEDALEHANGRLRPVGPLVSPPPEETPPPKRSKPRVPFRARSVPHRRGNRTGPPPIIATRGAGPEKTDGMPRGRDAVARLQNLYAEQGEEAAIELLHELCSESASWSVDDRERFARDLAKWLGSFEPVRWPLFMAADEHFNWSKWVDDALAGRLEPPIWKVVSHLRRRAAVFLRAQSEHLSNGSSVAAERCSDRVWRVSDWGPPCSSSTACCSQTVRIPSECYLR